MRVILGLTVFVMALAMAACSGDEAGRQVDADASAERFSRLLHAGQQQYLSASIGYDIQGSDVVVRGTVVDVEPVPNADVPFVAVVVEVDKTLAGEFTEGDPNTIRIMMRVSAGISVGEIRRSIPRGGIESLHALLQAPVSLEPGGARTYVHPNQEAAVLRGGNGGTLGFASSSRGDSWPYTSASFDATVAKVEAMGGRVDERRRLLGGTAGQWVRDSGGQGASERVFVQDWPEDAHCEWAPLALLYFRPDGGQSVQFVRADEADPPAIAVSGYFEASATLPVDAEDTGYSKNGARLFATPALDFVWIVFDDHTEQWPRQEPALACA